MSNWKQIPGWCDFEATYRNIVTALPGGTLVEVGCYLGQSLCLLGQLAKESGKPFRVVGVDHCRGTGPENGRDNHGVAVRAGGGSFVGQLLTNVLNHDLQGTVSLIVADSLTAASFFTDGSLAMVFLDAAHDYDSVKADVLAWLPKVRQGGVLAGDDIGVPGEAEPIWPGVKRAVSELLPGWKHSPHDAWVWEKR